MVMAARSPVSLLSPTIWPNKKGGGGKVLFRASALLATYKLGKDDWPKKAQMLVRDFHEQDTETPEDVVKQDDPLISEDLHNALEKSGQDPQVLVKVATENKEGDSPKELASGCDFGIARNKQTGSTGCVGHAH